MSQRIKIKQLTSGTIPFGNVLISDGFGDFTFTDISGLTYNIDKGTVFPISPENGDIFYRTDINYLFYYDDTRTKWLSVEKSALSCGRANAQFNASVYMRVGDATQTSTSGFKMKRNGTILGVTIENNSVLTSNRNIEVRVNDSVVNRVLATINTGQSSVVINNSNLDFNQNDIIQVIAISGASGSGLNNVIVTVNIAYRV